MTGPRTLATDYDVYDLAYLAGGPHRLTDTALVALVESGRIRVVPLSGELSAGERRASHPVESAVLDAIGPRGNRSIDTVRWRVESDERLRAIARRLELDGLLSPAWAGRPVGPHAWRLLAVTRSGRRALREVRSDPPHDRIAGETDALSVALAGPERMSDRDLYAAVFQPPRPPRTRWSAARLDRGTAAYGGAASYGWAGGFTDGGGGFCGDGGGGAGSC